MTVFGFEVSNHRVAEALTRLVVTDLARDGIPTHHDAQEFLELRLSERLAQEPDPVSADKLMYSEDVQLGEFENDIGPFGVMFFAVGRLSEAIRTEVELQGIRTGVELSGRREATYDVAQAVMAGLCPLPPIC